MHIEIYDIKHKGNTMAEFVLDTKGMTQEEVDAWVEVIDVANEYHKEIHANEGEAIGLEVAALRGGLRNNLKVLGSLFVYKQDTKVLAGKVNDWAMKKRTVIPKPVYVEKKKKEK